MLPPCIASAVLKAVAPKAAPLPASPASPAARPTTLTLEPGVVPRPRTALNNCLAEGPLSPPTV